MSGLPFNLLDGVSLTAGIIAPHQESKIHIMPYVTQITFVRHGILDVQMKGSNDVQPYLLHLKLEQAVITEPRTFLQLINISDEPCDVLYIVTPAYLFEMVDSQVIYDNAMVLDESWSELERANWCATRSLPAIEERKAAELRMSYQDKAIRA